MKFFLLRVGDITTALFLALRASRQTALLGCTFGAGKRNERRRDAKLLGRPAYRDTVEACIPEGVEEELLP